jgi:hypothetical protein
MDEIIYCKKSVYPAGMRFPLPHRCMKKAWKDGFCKTHHPENVKIREQESAARYKEQWEQSPTMKLIRALERIKELEAIIKTLSSNKEAP